MALILREAFRGYLYLFDEITDQKTKSWLFVAKPYQVFLLIGLYLMFVLRWGPKFMKNRQPYNIDKLLIVYNGLQVIFCMFLFVKAITLGWGWKYKWICEPVDHSDSEEAVLVAKAIYWYYLSKIVDLLDTVFFVLRKKFNQISFLHVYHHTGMLLLVWAAVTYLPGGHGTLVGVINTFVHIVMYAYYMMSVIVPAIKKSLFIKKLVTQLQILQFLWCALHMLALIFKTDCEYPRWTAAAFLPQNIFMLVLFIDFYIKTYIRIPKLQANNHTLNNNIETEKNKEFVTTKTE